MPYYIRPIVLPMQCNISCKDQETISWELHLEDFIVLHCRMELGKYHDDAVLYLYCSSLNYVSLLFSDFSAIQINEDEWNEYYLKIIRRS